MAELTYKTNALVLRKTKLGETDLIVTMLGETGELLKAVAKGARKPKSSFASRLEVYRAVEIHCAKGRSLDIVKEARLLDGPSLAELELEQTLSAAPVAELLARIAQPDLEHPRLYDLSISAFEHIAQLAGNTSLSICAAALLKVMALAGFRPSLDECIGCGRAVDGSNEGDTWFSYTEGGVVCDNCRVHADVVKLDATTMSWCRAYLYSTFDEIAGYHCDLGTVFSVLHFDHEWVKTHVQANLKSLDFMFTSGLFS